VQIAVAVRPEDEVPVLCGALSYVEPVA